MEPEYMVFEVEDFEIQHNNILGKTRLPSVAALHSFTHMCSVDKRPIPIFKCKRTSDWVYFCIFDGILITAYKDITDEETKPEVKPNDVELSPPV